MGIYLAVEDRVPDHVVASPAERALTTAEKCCKSMGVFAKSIVKDRRIYLAGPEQLLAVLADCPKEKQRVLLVGHNPGLEELLQFLADAPIATPEDGKLLPTATLAQLTMPDDWSHLSAGCAHLLSITRPGGLPQMFPFPSPHGQELRKRPAYYYRQCAALPYRLRNGKAEFLVVTSRGRKHWVLPKGIQDPGLKPWEAAAKEALEEAGIKGELEPTELGVYRYRKWGADCEVSVFPMAVTRVLDSADWPEHNRRRKWLAPKKVIELLEQPKLKSLVKKFQKSLEK